MPRATVLAGSYERFVFGYAHARGAASDASDGATTTTLAKRFTVDAHLASVKAVACAGGLAASEGSDDLIRVYHCDASGAMADLGTCVGHGGDARALEFYAPRGYAPTRLLSGGADGALMVWDASDNFELLKTMRAHRGGVCAISAHRSGKVALTSGCDAHVAMWDMRRGRVAYKFKTPERVEGLAFTCDGSEYVSRLTQKITLTDVEAGSVVTSFTTPAKTLTFDARGRMLCSRMYFFTRNFVGHRLVIVHRTCYVVHRDRFFSFRLSQFAKYCNASRVFASSSSRAAASTTRFFRTPSFLMAKLYHHWPT